MALLPNGERAIVDMRKLTSYALDTEHAKGKHKARVFAAALGATLQDAGAIAAALRNAASQQPTEPLPPSPFGMQYRLDFEFNLRGRNATIRSIWTILHGEDRPRLTSAWVK